ncbi:MAG: hypothetical protein HOK30_01075 [Rhodospirillaceae bacterium]|jgi:adenylate cyclase|nr:hypothetical protein [Rhodospirillaceae bacterium]MBT5191986.1 hypothetical protein [Rhodospirillaceae bacterium]MBT6426227.1 hypothetical protein [Rhodospirillaceae bacterium]
MSAPVRKLAAILAVDVVGYSRLMGEDQARTLDALRQLRRELFEPVVEEFRGNVVKRMGDGWIVEFASVSDAVDCAIRFQEGLAGHDIIRLRAGIHIGEVVFEDEDVFGEGVNVAARLEELAEPGEVLISDTVQNSLDKRSAQDFSGGDSHQLNNIERSVDVWRWSSAGAQQATLTESEAPVLTDKPSIAVLPFDNMSGDPEQEYFADGITEDIITELSRFREFLVIARNSTFVYKGEAKDLSTVARELNARYIVEGSVRKAGNRVRVTAQLIEGATNTHLWADRFDGVLADIFALQDEITVAIVSAVAPRSVQAEAERSATLSATQLSSWDSLLRARALLASMDRDGILESMPLLRTAIRQNPRNAQAHSWLAFALFFASAFRWFDDPDLGRDEAVAVARQAVALDPDDALSHVVSGLVDAFVANDMQAGARAYERALQINPNFAMAYGFMGGNQAIIGDFAVARRHFDQAWRLSPRDPSASVWQILYNMGLYGAKRYDDVVRGATEAIGTNPDFAGLYRQRAAALAMLGRMDEAREDIKQVLRLDPGNSIKIMRETPFWRDIEPFLEGLRKAGLPEE